MGIERNKNLLDRLFNEKRKIFSAGNSVDPKLQKELNEAIVKEPLAPLIMTLLKRFSLICLQMREKLGRELNTAEYSEALSQAKEQLEKEQRS